MSDCVACTSPTDAMLCPRCGDDLAADLTAVPDLCTELDITRTRQDRINGDNAGRRSAEQALPWKEPAADAAWVLHQVLAAWAVDLADLHDDTTLNGRTTPLLATWLLRRVDWLRQHPQAERGHDEIRDAIRNARRAIDRPPALPYAGRCHQCGEHMYSRMDRPIVTCRACEHPHDTEQLRRYLLDSIEHMNLTAPELASHLPALLGAPLPLATIKAWIQRRRLFRSGRNTSGHDVYRIHDVVTLAVSRPTRRATSDAA